MGILYKKLRPFLAFNPLSVVLREFPSCCAVCKNFGIHPIPNLCCKCEQSLPYLQNFCQRCALPIEVTSAHCGNCIKLNTAFDACRAAFIFQDPVNNLISAYKNHQQQALLGTLAALFCKQMQLWETAEKQPDILIPVPLHWRRQIMRGFNQSHELCKFISRQTGIPVEAKILKRVSFTPHQTGLGRKQRLRNLKHAFIANHAVENLSVILFDDVVTTGATVEAAAKALKQAGAAHVTVWSLARTPKNT